MIILHMIYKIYKNHIVTKCYFNVG